MTLTILVIEDQEQNQYLMKYMLEAQDHRVVLAGDGEAGIEAASRERPDLILLDIQLPNMSGHEVARILKANPDVAPIPIVAVTSYAMPGDREMVMASGCTGYIEKPINPDTFVDEILQYVPKDRDSHGRATDKRMGGSR
jgi:two-component system cell cycle response regulator DivK